MNDQKQDNEDQRNQPQAPKPQLHAKGHKTDPPCECNMCKAIRQKHARSLELPPQKRRVGPRQIHRQKFVAELTDPASKGFANASKAAVLAGLPATKAPQLLAEKQTQDMILAAMRRQGLTDEKLAQKLADGLEAYETKLAVKDGRFTDEKQVPDFHARFKYQQLVHQLRGELKREEKQEGALVIIRASILTPGHQRHCQCPSCTEALEKLAQKCREQVSRVPEPAEE